MNEPRDTLVGDALRRLDVPDHAPDFWARLEATLSGTSTGATPDVDDDHDADVIELDAARAGLAGRSRRSARAPLAAAAAAVAAIALAVGLPAAQQVADGDRDSQVDLADAPEGASVPDPSTPVVTDPTAMSGPADIAPEQIAADWLTLLRDGEVEQAHALLDETSQQALPLEVFGEVATGLAEGAGSFAELEPSVVPLVDDEGLAATAVVFTGDVEREGMIETASYAVVVTGDPEDPSRGLRIGFSLDGPIVRAETTDPATTQTSPLELTLSPTAGATWAVIDGTIVERIDVAGTGAATIDVEAIAGAGTHTVAVISTEGGRYTSGSSTVVVP